MFKFKLTKQTRNQLGEDFKFQMRTYTHAKLFTYIPMYVRRKLLKTRTYMFKLCMRAYVFVFEFKLIVTHLTFMVDHVFVSYFFVKMKFM